MIRDDSNSGSCGNTIAEHRHICGAHPDTPKACRATQEIFLRRTMDIDATIKRVFIAGLFPLEPEDAGDNRIATGSIWLQDLTGRYPGVKDRAQGLAHADLHPHQEFSKRSSVASKAVTDPKTRG